MHKIGAKLRKIKVFVYNWLFPIVNISRLKRIVPAFLKFFNDWAKYSKSAGAQRIHLIDSRPCLFKNTKLTVFHSHYFYQYNWAFKRIFKSKVKYHVDVGSSIDLANTLSVVTRVTFIDIRPLKVRLDNFDSIKGSILSMPYKDNSVLSLSCLHVAEHIGLGRYGDSIDPLGTQKAAKELSRVLFSGGNLFFSLPVGKPKLIFNCRRIHSTQQILDYFSGLKLIELSGVDDRGNFTINIDRAVLDSCDCGCGMFWFTKR